MRRFKLFSVSMAAAALAAFPARDVRADETPNHVSQFRVKPSAEGAGITEIEITGTRSPTYQLRSADGGKRLFVDLSNSDLVGVSPALTQPVGVVGGVLAQSYQSEGTSTTRFDLNLTKNSTYRVRAEGNVLKVFLTPSGALIGPGAGKEGEIVDVTFERTPAQPASTGACTSGCDRIAITTGGGNVTHAFTTSESGKLRLELRGAKLPPALERTLDVSSYKGALKMVSSFNLKGAVILEIERIGEGKGEVTTDGNRIYWAFDVPRLAGDGGAARRTMTLEREAAPKVLPISTSVRKLGGDEVIEGGEAGFTSNVSAQTIGTGGKFGGRRIDLDLKDADIHNILRLLSDVGHVNIVTADDVAGSVTIRMRNVPWDQALDVVLQAKGLGMVRQGNLVRVAPLATLNKEREMRLAQLKQEVELAPLETRIIPVSYASAEELQLRAKDFLSPRGTLAVDERTNVLIARDIAGNLNRIEELVRSLDTQTPQVLVEARIVEATSRYLRDIGIQWGGDATYSSATGNPTGASFPSKVGLAGGATDGSTPTGGLSPSSRTVSTPNFAINLPATAGTGVGGALGLVLGSLNQNFNLNVRLSAAETSGLLRIVSSPRILTLDNRDARISQGTLIPFSQTSAQGVQTTFQEAKLQLLVKPHVTADGSVAMHVKINRDEPDFNQTSARGDPTILKREAETDLLVMDGHTAVIGGIFTRNTGRNVDQIPFFGDLPILGILFQRRRASDSRNELVIFLTPRIVNRAEALGR